MCVAGKLVLIDVAKMPEKGKDPPFEILITCARFSFPKYVTVEFGREEEVELLNEEWFRLGRWKERVG